MLADISYATSQSLLRQRNVLAGLCVILLLLCGALVAAYMSRDERVILVPTLSTRAALTASYVSPDYLEHVTRDVAYMTLNRTPAGLDYWMEEVLQVVHPSAYGRIKAELLKIVTEQRGSDVSQSFRLMGLRVDAKALVSEVTGELSTIVGKQVVAKERRRYRMTWDYTGFRLSLVGFERVELDEKEARP